MASTYLERTLSGTSTNRKLCTFSYWVKRSDVADTKQGCIGGFLTNSSGQNLQIGFFDNAFYAVYYDGAIVRLNLVSSALARDVSAWYHVVVAIDTTQATTSNRAKMYVNGVQVTSFTTSDYPVQNVDFPMTNGFTTHIGKMTFIGSTTEYLDGLMASVYFIDGQALTPSSFGETDATTGIWKPKSYSGTYGTNGFFLKFENSGSLGLDSSGNGNNFTVNGTPTQTVDTPSNNFATLNPISNNTSGIFLYGNLYYDGNSTNNWSKAISATLAVSKGKWYWEAKATSATDADYQQIGVAKVDKLAGNTTNLYQADFANVVQLHPSTPTVFKAVGSNYYLNSGLTTNDTVMMALDTDNGKMWVGKNGSWFANSSGSTGSPNAGTHPVWDTAEFTVGETYVPVVTNYYAAKMTFNFGSGYFDTTAISSPYSDGAGLGKFQYQPPTGYYALCTKNINVYG